MKVVDWQQIRCICLNMTDEELGELVKQWPANLIGNGYRLLGFQMSDGNVDSKIRQLQISIFGDEAVAKRVIRGLFDVVSDEELGQFIKQWPARTVGEAFRASIYLATEEQLEYLRAAAGKPQN